MGRPKINIHSSVAFKAFKMQSIPSFALSSTSPCVSIFSYRRSITVVQSYAAVPLCPWSFYCLSVEDLSSSFPTFKVLFTLQDSVWIHICIYIYIREGEREEVGAEGLSSCHMCSQHMLNLTTPRS